MADRYLVAANTASYSSHFNATSNWSETSGGAGGASVPVTGDLAIIDGNSPEAFRLGTQQFQIYGTGTNRCSWSIRDNAAPGFAIRNGTFQMESDIIGLRRLTLWGSGAKLYSNDYNISIGGSTNSNMTYASFEATDGASVYLGTSTITLADAYDSYPSYSARYPSVTLSGDGTFSTENATFVINSKYSGGNIYIGSGITVGSVQINIDSIPDPSMAFLVYSSGFTINNLSILGDGRVLFNIYGTASTFYTPTSLVLEGDSTGGLILQDYYSTGEFGSLDPNFWTIHKATGDVNVYNCTIIYGRITGDGVFSAFDDIDGNVDGGNNEGWVFSRPFGIPPLELGWVLDGGGGRELNAALSFPSLSIQAWAGVAQPFGAFEISIYPITVTAYGGGHFSKSIPSIELSASGVTDIVGTLSKALPRIEIHTTAHQDGIGEIELVLPYIRLSASGFISPIGDMDRAIPAVRLTASAIAGIVGNLEKEIGAIILDASSYWQDENGSVLSMPALRLYAHAQSAIWEMIAVNTKNNGLTNYSNYEYNSLCVMNDQVFGAKSDGIYLLEGDDDNGEDISWSLKTGKIDVENELSQRVRHIWFSRRSSGDLLLIVNDGETEYEYPVTAYSETDDAVRVKIGKGIKSKYIQLELKNLGNETIRLDSFKLFADKRPRQR